MRIEKESYDRWVILANAEESFLRQKSRIYWLAEGDSNSTFFHRSMLSRQSRNHIHFLTADDGAVIDTREGIETHVLDFFRSLLGGSPTDSLASPNDIARLVPFRCSDRIVELLDAPFSSLDIRNALFALPKSKAPGPDGYPADFFTANWATVGFEFTAAVAEFFSSGVMLKQWNATAVTLVPKITNASRLKDFRPISCCNTVYKVASKLLANRLKQVLPDIISSSQSAFIPGRILAENVLLATELVQGYNWKRISKRSMLKVDLKKAFDSVNWSFILNTLQALNFPPLFRQLLSQCITTTQFSIAINGELCGYFKGARGLRQGDPLSPYLFVLVLEVFSKMLSNKFMDSSIGYHPSATNPCVSHLAFADDIMIFFDGQRNSLRNITDTLDTFSAWSGLAMNRDKTDLFIAGLNHAETQDISCMGFHLGSMPIRYLGLPLMHRKLRLTDYRPLIDQLVGRFNSWSVRSLSFVGRKQLLSSVIYGTINFWCSVFILPRNCLRRIESLCSRFLWGNNIEVKAKAKVSWSGVCLPKDEGGLGLRNFRIWNQTLCLKLIWMLYTKLDSLWVQWIKSYRLRDGIFWNVNISSTHSWTWKSLLHLRPLAGKFMRCSVGNGLTASFWFDHWTPFGPLINFFGQQGPRELGINLASTVSSACSINSWRFSAARFSAAEQLLTYLTTIPLPSASHDDDTYSWHMEDHGQSVFSTRGTWELLRPRDTKKPWVENVWFKGAVPRQAFLFWVVELDRLPLRSRLANWGLNVPITCCLWNTNVETRDHLFLRCDFSRQLWLQATARLDLRPFSFHTWTALTVWMSNRSSPPPRFLRRIVAHSLISIIWQERNSRLHCNISATIAGLFIALDRSVKDSILLKIRRKPRSNLLQSWLRRT